MTDQTTTTTAPTTAGPLDDTTLAEIEARAAAATPAPWAIWHDLDHQGHYTVGEASGVPAEGAAFADGRAVKVACAGTEPDAEFIVAAPRYVRELAAEVRRLRGELAAVKRDKPNRPRIVVLCGSTRFVNTFNFWRQRLTYDGQIVLSIEIVTAQDPAEIGPERKALLDRLHRHKIDLADEVLVINPGGYIGESTASEIAYAQEVGRPVRYLEPVAPLDEE